MQSLLGRSTAWMGSAQRPLLSLELPTCPRKKCGRQLDCSLTKTPSSRDLLGEIPGVFSKADLFSLEGNILFIGSDSHMEQVREHCPPQLARA